MQWFVSSAGESRARNCRIEGHGEEWAGFVRGRLVVGELPLSRCYCEVRLIEVQRWLSSQAPRDPHRPLESVSHVSTLLDGTLNPVQIYSNSCVPNTLSNARYRRECAHPPSRTPVRSKYDRMIR